MEKIRDFMRALKTSPQAAELTRNMPAPRDDLEAIECYTYLAVHLGCDITKEEITEGLAALALEQQSQSAAAEREVGKTSIPEEALDHVAGGIASSKCEETYEEGEWCWYSDCCDKMINIY